MPAPRTPMRNEAAKLCRQFPNMPSATLATRLAATFPNILTKEQARNHIRMARGSRGVKSRKNAEVKQPLRKAGQHADLPPSQCSDWQEYRIDGPARVGVLSDIHIPYHSEIAVKAAVDYLRSRHCTDILLNGDIADFYTISRHEKDPRKRNFSGEINGVRNFLKYLRKQFPKQRIHYKAGNHEERWYKFLWQRAPEFADCEQLELDKFLNLADLDIAWVEDQRPIRLGGLPVFHGHELPKGMASPVNMARGNFLRMNDTCLTGHGHRTSHHVESDWEHNEVSTWSTGCLCGLNPEYARINKWNWGFAEIEVHSGGEFDVHNLRITLKGKVRQS